jgi:outer membrane protein assembly factor BamB
VTEDAVYVTAARPAPGHRSPAAPYVWLVGGLTALLVLGAAALLGRGCVEGKPSVPLGVLVIAACWLVIFSEHYLLCSRGPERAWLAAGVLGALCLIAGGLPAGPRGKFLSGLLLVAWAAVLQVSLPNRAQAYEDGPFSPKSVFHYLVVAIPLVAGGVVLAWRRGGGAFGPWVRRVSLALAGLLALAVIALGVIDQRHGSLILSATPYQPRVPLWLPIALGLVAAATHVWRQRRPALFSRFAAILTAVAFWPALIGWLLERPFVSSEYLAYQLGRPESHPLLGWPGVWALVGLGAGGLVASVCVARKRPGFLHPSLQPSFQAVTTALAAAFLVYALYAPKDPTLLYQVLRLDRKSGELTWRSRGVIGARGPMHSDNAPATPTPVCDGQRVYAWFGTPGLECVSVAGEQLWVTRKLHFSSRHGVASSPVLCEGKVIILSESDAGCYLAAIDCATGEQLWRAERHRGTHRYAGNCRTPTVRRLDGRTTVVVWGLTDLTGYDPTSGRELWSHNLGDLGRGSNPVASLVSDERRFYLVGPARMLALDLAGLSGPTPPIAWELDQRTGAQCPSPVLVEGLLFVASDHGGLYCLDAETGQVVWEERRPGVNYASPVAVGDRIYFCNTAGRATVVRASRRYEELAANDLREVVHASFAPVGEQLFVRTAQHLYCLVEGAGGVAPEEPETKAPPPSDGVAVPAASAVDLAADWSRFRGATGSGVSGHADLPSRWDGATGEGVLWRTPVPLPGFGSPIVGGDRIYCVGADARAQHVYCFDAAGGKLLWTGQAPTGPPMPSLPDMTGYAPSTPVTDGQRVGAIFPNGRLVCFGRDGQRLWDRDLGVPENHYGHASSLVLSGDLLIVQYDQGAESDGRSRLFAFEFATGKPVWEVARETAASWATPLLIRTDAREELITSAQPWLIAYDPAQGRELWRAACVRGEVAPSPIFAGGLVFVVSDQGSLAAVRPGGQGDVTQTHVLWTASDGLPDTCSPVSDGTFVYLLTTSGLLTCVQASDGATVWQEQLDGAFRASPSLAGDRLYLVSETGETLILATGRQFRELARCPLGEPVSASPAFAPGRVYLRARNHLFCLGSPGS